ncbi:alcohol dehydrogenase catalytic domain-containing protein [Mycobacterium yunnanensis]|uniref:Alcohol dehydrogenase catalytic domain-containing protein n=1 Tax=Mycobacterium yunnanensis TaxID=368477 RepID=A0A9X2YHW8_9MYCO|nr:alcohol dehydrogenase catalytic domain-containing protein [Mycobacterium yunnanensis]MCV7419577.1 alcohol dehydrogenase catalytic domain-containing protein [Mycobacterium yunnanensis]
MRNVVITGPGSVEVRDAPDPVLPGADGAVVGVESAAICGSDLHFYDGDLPVGDGVAVGHEFIGTVLEVGPEVSNVRVGDRVLASSVTGCGTCAGCATGNPVTCARGMQIFGSGVLGGGQATAVAVPAADFQLLGIPDGVDDEAALLLTDNLSTGWIGAKKADIPPGGTVLVIGLGAVGLCAVRAAVAQGAGTVLAADPVAGRRALAVDSGATALEGPTVAAVLEHTDGRGVDSVVDTVALNATLDDALASVRADGTVSVLGVHDLQPYPLPILMALIRNLTLRMTTAPIQQTWVDLLPLVTSGSLRTDGIFTHRFPLADAPDAYAAVAARSPECVKVILRP